MHKEPKPISRPLRSASANPRAQTQVPWATSNTERRISRRNLHQLQETAEILSDLLAIARRLLGVDEEVARGSSSSAKSGVAR
ncbi:MAG: hypothetical protein JWM33_3483 [Caulobacteraceae bacterium]|nr:hypothetical protein [Caulobacteraceae bacterium]